MITNEAGLADKPVRVLVKDTRIGRIRSTWFFMALLLTNCVEAQQHAVMRWCAAYQDSSTSYYVIQSAVLDGYGNFYATGYTADNSGVRKVTTERYSPSGKTTLFEHYDSTSTGSQFGTSIAADDLGASYVAGISYPTNVSTEGILIKYSPGGSIDWVRHYPVYATSCLVVLDSTDDIYLGINTDRGSLIWKLNRSGMTMDSISISDSASMSGKSIVQADSGNLFIVGNRGYCYTDADDPMPICFNDVEIVKLDPYFHILWAKVVPNEEAIAAQRDRNGNLVVLDQGFLHKYSSEGDTLWSKKMDNEEAYMGLAIDSHSRITVIGYGASENPYDAAVMYDPNGNVRWTQMLSYLPIIQYMAIALDSTDNIYITGDLDEDPSGVLCLTTKLDTAGNQIWKTTFAATNYIYNIGSFVALDDSANVYVGSASSTEHTGGYVVVKYSQVSSTGLTKPFDEVVHDYSLSQNYPNPFNPTTTISYQLPINSLVSLKIYDVLGREIKSLVNERQIAGSHSATVDASGLASGVYLYRIDMTGTDGKRFTASKKLLLLK